MRGTKARRHEGTKGNVIGALCIAIALCAIVVAQVRIQDGHTLDSNLQMGSGGYNTAHRTHAGASMYNTRYSPGTSKPLYNVDRNGNMRYSRNNAFNPSSRYRATGYTGDRSSQSWRRRFRYGGQGGG